MAVMASAAPEAVSVGTAAPPSPASPWSHAQRSGSGLMFSMGSLGACSSPCPLLPWRPSPSPRASYSGIGLHPTSHRSLQSPHGALPPPPCPANPYTPDCHPAKYCVPPPSIRSARCPFGAVLPPPFPASPSLGPSHPSSGLSLSTYLLCTLLASSPPPCLARPCVRSLRQKPPRHPPPPKPPPCSPLCPCRLPCRRNPLHHEQHPGQPLLAARWADSDSGCTPSNPI